MKTVEQVQALSRIGLYHYYYCLTGEVVTGRPETEELRNLILAEF